MGATARTALAQPQFFRLPHKLLSVRNAPDSVVQLVTHITATSRAFGSRANGAHRYRIFGSLPELADATGMPLATVKRSLAWLRENNMLLTTADPGKPSKRYLLVPSRGYVQVPMRLALLDLTSVQIRLVALLIRRLVGRAGEPGRCQDTREELAEQLGVAVRTITEAVEELRRLGAIAVHHVRGMRWHITVPGAAPRRTEPPAAVLKAVEQGDRQLATEARSASVHRVPGRAEDPVPERADTPFPNEPTSDLRKRPAPTRARNARARSTSTTPPSEGVVNERAGVGVSRQARVRNARANPAAPLRVAAISDVLAALPAPLRERLPQRMPVRVVALVRRQLDSHTPAQLAERAARRWSTYAGSALDPVAVAWALLAPRCANEACEDGRIPDGAGGSAPCRTCELWPAEQVREHVERAVRERWRPRGPLHDWRDRRGLVSSPGIDWRRHKR